MSVKYMRLGITASGAVGIGSNPVGAIGDVMKKKQEKTGWILMVGLLMLSSSMAYIFFQGTSETTPTQTNLPSFVLNTTLDAQTREYYLSKGITIMEFYCPTNCPSYLDSYVNSLPELLEYQIIVERLEGDTAKMVAEGMTNKVEKNVVSAQEIDDALCSVLIKPPIACGLKTTVE